MIVLRAARTVVERTKSKTFLPREKLSAVGKICGRSPQGLARAFSAAGVVGRYTRERWNGSERLGWDVYLRPHKSRWR